MSPEQDSHPVPGGRAAARRAARSRRTADRTDPIRRLLPQALVVAALAGGTSAFVAHDKAVRLTVDGEQRTLHTYADDVGELLAEEKVAVGRHDIVAPAPGQSLDSGDEVAVRYGRPVTLTVDGRSRRVWTTAGTVDGALHQLGVRADGAFLSASRSAGISRRGLSLDVRTERTVTFMADGREHTVRTNVATVGEALEAAGLTLRGQDTTSVPGGSFPRDGQTVKVMRITRGKEVRHAPVPFTTVRRADPTVLKGTEVVERQGRPGSLRTVYQVRTVNGVRERPHKLESKVVKQPVSKIVRVGTGTAPPPPASPQGGSDGLNWDAVAHCESGGRADAVDSSGRYGGLYQMDRQTWRSVGGSGNPQDAPASEQTYRAKKLYVQRGSSPWPNCGRQLHR
ncbi:ubiquitin-like domain-containing protein [Streptomyces sp. NPDC048636]|uniref:ubiquitin-like domain-containing protein n=1 Tax=Streptomyces sp. NPDC048636 TaxID=3155762 RepID=UPI00341EF853